MQVPKRINPRWLQQQRSKLDCTVKIIRGETNPNYLLLKEEIESAEREIVRWEKFANWMHHNHHAIINRYVLRKDGNSHEPGTVFFSKDASGYVEVWSILQAWALYEEAIFRDSESHSDPSA